MCEPARIRSGHRRAPGQVLCAPACHQQSPFSARARQATDQEKQAPEVMHPPVGRQSLGRNPAAPAVRESAGCCDKTSIRGGEAHTTPAAPRLGGWSPRARRGQGRGLPKPLSSCVDGRPPPVSSRGRPSVRVCVHNSPLCKDPSHTDQSPPHDLMTFVKTLLPHKVSTT